MRLIHGWGGARQMTRGTNEGSKWTVIPTEINFGQYVNRSHHSFAADEQWKIHLFAVARSTFASCSFAQTCCYEANNLTQLGLWPCLGTQLAKVSPMCVTVLRQQYYYNIITQHLFMWTSESWLCEKGRSEERQKHASALENNRNLLSVADIVGCNIHWGKGLGIIALPLWSLSFFFLLSIYLSFNTV